MSTSKVQEFFKDQTVLVTGCTGLIGKLLLRKLLSTCNDVKQIYLLLRDRKTKSAEERFDELLETYCFQSLEVDKQNLKRKCKVIKGNCAFSNLDISEENQKVLINEVTCIIHTSATIKFDEHVRIAGYTNVRSVMDLLRLAKDMKNLKAMVYVSTAYSNCNQTDEIKEIFYDPPMTAVALMKLLETVDDDQYLSDITPRIIDGWPNTYTFTKAVAENLIKENGRNLPVIIIRPGIVLGAVQEPEPGYTDTLQGLTAVCVGVYLGIIRCFMLKNDNTVALVPSDYVVNNILSAVSYTNKTSTEIPIYNFVGSLQNKINWGQSMKYGVDLSKAMPTMRSIWWTIFIYSSKENMFNFYAFWLHTVPAQFVDFILRCVGKKPQFVKLYEKINKGMNLFKHFTLNSWNFNNTNTENLWKIMSEKDKELFPYNMDQLNWEKYITNNIKSTRIRVLKDPFNTLQKAKMRQVALRIVHYITIVVLLYILYMVLRLLLSVFV